MPPPAGPPPHPGAHPGYPAPPPGGPPVGKKRRGLLAVALIAVAVLAIGALAFLVVRAVRGESGGASSPQAAVEDLAAAFEAEDPVAALEIMNPDEVEILADVYTSVAERAAALGFAPEDKTLGGIAIDLEGVTYEVAEIGDGVSRVTLTGGTADLSYSRSSLGTLTDRVVVQRARAQDDAAAGAEGEAAGAEGEAAAAEGEAALSTDDLTVAAEGSGSEVRPFVVTVKRGGGWYVSPLYTAAQYAVDVLGLQAPTLPAPDAGDGADSPEAAVRQLLVAAGAADSTTAGDLLAGATGDAARAYAGAIEAWIADEIGTDTSIEVTELTTETRDRDGGGERVVITALHATATWTDADGPNQLAVTWDGTCIRSGDPDEVGGDGGAGDEDFCLTDNWRRFGVTELAVAVAEAGGGWRVDPVATLADYAEAIVPTLTDTAVLRLIGFPEVAEPSAEAAMGTPTTVELNDVGYAVVTVAAQEGRAFTVTATADGRDVDAFLVDPGGRYESASDLIEPDADGTYLLVVGTADWSPGPVQVTVSGLTRRALRLGDTVEGEITQEGEVVEYTVTLEEGAGYELDFDNPDLQVQVLDPDGSPVSLEGRDDITSTFTAPSDGGHKVRVSGDGRATGGFELGLARAPDLVATNLANGQVEEPPFRFVMADPDTELANFELQVRHGVTIAVEATPDQPDLDLRIVVLADGEEITFDGSGAGGAEAFTFTSDADLDTVEVQVDITNSVPGAFGVAVTIER